MRDFNTELLILPTFMSTYFVYPKGLVHILAVFVDEVHVVEHGTPEASAHLWWACVGQVST